MATELTNTNPLDFPRYVKSLRPSLPESLPSYVDDELEKVSEALTTLEEASNNHADARVEEERLVRVTEDEALAARITTVEAEFQAADSVALARIEAEEIARSTADEALASRVTTVEAEFGTAISDATARITVEELARATADEALASRIETTEAEFRAADSLAKALVRSEAYARSTEDEAIAVRIDTVEADYQTADATISASVTSEAIARANADEALASLVETVEAEYQTADATLSASITSEATARATADSALASDITTVTATVNAKNKTFWQTTAPTATAVGDLWFDTDDNNKPYRWNGTTWELAADARVAANTAAIVTEQTARIDGDTALASDITTVTTTVSGHTSTLTSYGTSISGLQAKYGVKLDVNGYVTGFEQNNGGGTSDFIIRADKFKVIMPGYAGGTPFTVDSGGVKINGDLIVTGTISGSKIIAGGVDTAQIANNAVSDMPYAYTDGTFSPAAGSSFQTIQTLALTSTGTPLKIAFACLSTYAAGDGGTSAVALRLQRGGVTVFEGISMFPISASPDYCFAEFIDTPSAGAVTYTVQASQTYNDSTYSKRYLSALQLKK